MIPIQERLIAWLWNQRLDTAPRRSNRRDIVLGLQFLHCPNTEQPMRKRGLISTIFAASALIAGACLSVPALAEQAKPQSPPKPYKVVAVQPPQAMKDASFEAFRKQLTGVAQKKDRAALAQIVSQNFFWISEDKDIADKTKPPIESLAKAIGLDGSDAEGWEILFNYAADPTADPNPDRSGVICTPGEPRFDDKAAEELERATGTETGDWTYPVRAGLEVRQTAKKTSPVIEKLGLHLVRVYPDELQAAADDETMRIVTPGGKVGFVLADALRPLYEDQICYVKEGAAWKIAGMIGGAAQ